MHQDKLPITVIETTITEMLSEIQLATMLFEPKNSIVASCILHMISSFAIVFLLKSFLSLMVVS